MLRVRRSNLHRRIGVLGLFVPLHHLSGGGRGRVQLPLRHHTFLRDVRNFKGQLGFYGGDLLIKWAVACVP